MTPEPESESQGDHGDRPVFRIGSETQIVDTTVKGNTRVEGEGTERPPVQFWTPRSDFGTATDPLQEDPPEGDSVHVAPIPVDPIHVDPIEPTEAMSPVEVPTATEAPVAPDVAVASPDKPDLLEPHAAEAGVTGVQPGVVDVLPSFVPEPGSTAGFTDAATVVDTRVAARGRRTERWVMVLSTVLGTLGLAVAFAAAALDQLRYDQPGPCAAYGTAHKGQTGFGCSTAAKHVAVLLPGIGIVALVLVALALVWVPQRTPAGRVRWLTGYVVLLVLAAIAVALAYSALPHNS